MNNAAPAGNNSFLGKLVAWHRAGALLIFNTLFLFAAVNALLWVAFAIRDRFSKGDQPSGVFPEASLAAVYPEFSTGEWKAMLKETWTRPYIFGGYTVFKEAPYQGRHVNVSEAGFRKVKNQGPWPLDSANVNIFVFGGSTMFGYGVADDQTFASYLEEELGRYSKKRVCVYNFGAGYYYSTQERILFERLLTHGQKPDAALFVDGLNDLWHVTDEPDFASNFAEVFKPSATPVFLDELPMMRLVKRVRRGSGSPASAEAREQFQKQLQGVPERYQRNVKVIEATCREFGVAPIFVWQPVPSYKYDTKYHLFYLSPEAYQNQAKGYLEMAELHKQGTLGPHFLWCADLQQDKKECLYVDNHHYTAKFAKELAGHVVALCRERGLLKPAGLELSSR